MVVKKHESKLTLAIVDAVELDYDTTYHFLYIGTDFASQQSYHKKSVVIFLNANIQTDNHNVDKQTDSCM